MARSARALVLVTASGACLIPVGCSIVAGLPSDYGLVGTSAETGPPDVPTPPDVKEATSDSPPPGDGALLDAGCGDVDTDPANCGACGHDCLGGTCAQVSCQAVTLATGESAPNELILVNNHLYWTAAFAVRSCALPDCAGPADVCPASGGVGLAGDPSNLYWTNSGDLSVRMGPTAGCDGGLPVNIAFVCSPDGIASDTSNVYWVENCGQPNGKIRRANLDGTSPTDFVLLQTNPSGLAIDPSSVYWTNFGDQTNSVLRTDHSGTAPATLGSGSGAFRIALGGGSLFWTNYNDGTLGVVPADGGDAGLFATGQSFPQYVAFDKGTVFWTNYAQNTTNAGSVMSCDAASCTKPLTLASGLTGPSGIVVDERRIYWTNYGGNSVMALAR